MAEYYKGWHESMSLEDTKNLAYWERNMLALLLAKEINAHCLARQERMTCGWYVHGKYKGWSRVISIADGKITFHIPDDFNIGDLIEIKPNWDGHTTEEKWLDIMKHLGVKHD